MSGLFQHFFGGNASARLKLNQIVDWLNIQSGQTGDGRVSSISGPTGAVLHTRVNQTLQHVGGRLPVAATKGTLAWYDGNVWVVLEPPAADSVLWIDGTTKVPAWVETIDECP